MDSEKKDVEISFSELVKKADIDIRNALLVMQFLKEKILNL